MKTEKSKTLVKFIKDKETNQIVAIFPKEYWTTWSKETVTCYAHIGQHSAASIEWVKDQPLANPEEYKALLSELKSIGYKELVILKPRKPVLSCQ